METYLNNNYENLNNALSSFQPEHCIFDHEEQISYQKPVSKQNSPKKINSIRTSLLLIADKEMTVKVKDNKDFKINSEIPKIVSSGVFEINYKEIIEFNSPSKEYKQERSAVTSKLNRIYLEADININPTVNIVDQFDIMQHKIQKLITTSFTNPEKSEITKAISEFHSIHKHIVRKKKKAKSTIQVNMNKSNFTDSDTPTKSTKSHNSRISSTESIKQNIEKRNTPGCYVENKQSYNRVLEGFVYLRTLPYMKNHETHYNKMNCECSGNYSNLNQQDEEIRQSEENTQPATNFNKYNGSFIKTLAKNFDIYKESLLIKDNLYENNKIKNRMHSDKIIIKIFLDAKKDEINEKNSNSSFNTPKKFLQIDRKKSLFSTKANIKTRTKAEISLFKDLSPENPEIMNNKHFYNSDNLIKKDNENNFEHKTIKKESNDSIPTINLVTNLYHDENDECEEGLLSPIHSDLPNGYL